MSITSLSLQKIRENLEGLQRDLEEAVNTNVSVGGVIPFDIKNLDSSLRDFLNTLPADPVELDTLKTTIQKLKEFLEQYPVPQAGPTGPPIFGIVATAVNNRLNTVKLVEQALKGIFVSTQVIASTGESNNTSSVVIHDLQNVINALNEPT